MRASAVLDVGVWDFLANHLMVFGSLTSFAFGYKLQERFAKRKPLNLQPKVERSGTNL